MLTRLRSKKEVLRNDLDDLATWTSQHINPFTQKPSLRCPFEHHIYWICPWRTWIAVLSFNMFRAWALFVVAASSPQIKTVIIKTGVWNSKIGRTRSFLLVPQTKRKDRTAKVIEVHKHLTTAVPFDFLTFLGVFLVGFLVPDARFGGAIHPQFLKTSRVFRGLQRVIIKRNF